MLPSSLSARPAAGLRRVLGLGFGLAVIVGSTLGIGILRTPGLVAGQLSTVSVILLVWIAGGLYTLLSAVCFAEPMSRSASITFAPSRANTSAAARPVPTVSPGDCPAPTTIPTLPSSLLSLIA